jgi:hypothetical protein
MGLERQRLTKCIIHGVDKEDFFLFVLSATAYTQTLPAIGSDRIDFILNN